MKYAAYYFKRRLADEMSCTLFLFEKSVIICEKIAQGGREEQNNVHHFDFLMSFKVCYLYHIKGLYQLVTIPLRNHAKTHFYEFFV